MQTPESSPSDVLGNILLRTFTMIFASLALFVVGLIVIDVNQAKSENAEERQELQQLKQL